MVGQAPGKYERWLLGPDGKRAVLSVKDGPAVLWGRGRGKEVRQLRDGSRAVPPICFSPDGRRLLCWGGLWDLTTGQEVRRGGGHQSTVSTAIAYHRWMVELLILGGSARPGRVRQWEMKSGKELP